MELSEPIRCRVAACRDTMHAGSGWSFYLINDGNAPLESAVLYEVSYEWGDSGNSEAADARVTDLAPGAHALIWQDDGSGAELRMELSLRVRARGREAALQFEFPKLYKLRNLQSVDGLGKPGWPVRASSPGRVTDS
jgi:hypothetical protein